LANDADDVVMSHGFEQKLVVADEPPSDALR
jgi:hypothetical protein